MSLLRSSDLAVEFYSAMMLCFLPVASQKAGLMTVLWLQDSEQCLAYSPPPPFPDRADSGGSQ